MKEGLSLKKGRCLRALKIGDGLKSAKGCGKHILVGVTVTRVLDYVPLRESEEINTFWVFVRPIFVLSKKIFTNENSKNERE